MGKKNPIRDLITVKNDSGQELSYEVEALFDMKDKTYALLRSNEETVLMQVKEDEHGQQLVGLENDSDREAILDAYQIAIAAAPAESDFYEKRD